MLDHGPDRIRRVRARDALYLVEDSLLRIGMSEHERRDTHQEYSEWSERQDGIEGQSCTQPRGFVIVPLSESQLEQGPESLHIDWKRPRVYRKTFGSVARATQNCPMVSTIASMVLPLPGLVMYPLA